MKNKIKVGSGFSGVISTGSYQNSRPSFNAEVEFEIEGDQDQVIFAVEAMQEELYKVCREKFNNVAEQEKIEKIKSDRKDFRFYEKDGVQLPSVTSILNYDSDFLIDENELKQYASQGTINHVRVEEFIKTGLWKSPKELPNIIPDLFILKSGSLQLDPDSCDFPELLKKFPLKELKNGQVLYNEIDRYAGTYDGECIYEGAPTIFDIKRTADKTKNFQQLAAYASCKGMEHIKQMMIIVLNDKTERGFSKPIISTDISKYQELFLYKRKQFKRVYGV